MLEDRYVKEKQVKEHFARQAGDYEKLMARLVPQYIEQNEFIYTLLPNDGKKLPGS